MDRSKVREIRDQLEAVLAAAKIPGTTVKVGSARFDHETVTFKVVFTENKADGEPAEAKEARDFKRWCSVHGFKPEHLGQVFNSRGHTFKIAGLLPRCYKNPILVVDVDSNKRYKMPADTVLAALERTSQARRW